MSKTLNQIRADLDGLRAKIKQVLDKMSTLNDRFFNMPTGAFSVYVAAIDTLADAKDNQPMPTRDLAQDTRPSGRGRDRVQIVRGEQRGATPLKQPAQPPNNEEAIARMGAAVEDAKARARKVSVDYWKQVDILNILRQGVLDLRRRCDEAVAKKIRQRERGEKKKPSKSIMALSELSDQLKNYSDQLALEGSVGPHKPDHKLLK